MITPEQAAAAASDPFTRMAANLEAIIDTNLTISGRAVISSHIRPDILYGPAEALPILEKRYHEAGWITRLDEYLLTIERPPTAGA